VKVRADEKCLCVEGARRDGPFVYRFEDTALSRRHDHAAHDARFDSGC
jgi:hypothetical protein